MLPRSSSILIATLVLVALAVPDPLRAFAPRGNPTPKPQGRQTFTSPQSNPILVDPSGSRVFVANTTSDTVTIVDATTLANRKAVTVGLEPVSLALRPGSQELWVSNHVSDSVSVVDVDAASATYGQVVETIQLLDANGVTLFDEPVGIAFAGPSKAYVALSSRNQIAIIDGPSYSVTGFIDVRAQDPRAIAVQGGLLYVAAFESSNQTELSACPTTGGSQCTLDNQDLLTFATNPNIPGETKNIVIDPQAPDRDLFVYDTTTDQEVDVVEHVGTLLYGLAVDSTGTAYVTQTDARNHVNGFHGDVLASLDNMMFENEIASVSCSSSGCGAPAVNDLEPQQTTPATALATPYGIAIDEANGHLLITAAASSRVASTTLSGTPISVIDVPAIPRGITFLPDAQGQGGTAWVLSSLAGRITRIDVAADGTLSTLNERPAWPDPTPLDVRNGRIAFNDAFASSSGNFACASCHPDGNVDQLLWRIGGDCQAMGCDPGDEPRSTMPVRGLKNTLPLHWDGTLGDPFGGPNGEIGGGGNIAPTCDPGGPDGDHDCFLDLVAGSLSGVMCEQPCTSPELDAQQRDDMASFLAAVAYPPARSRRMDDSVSRRGQGVSVGSLEVSALQGFNDFFMDQGAIINTGPTTCADQDVGCHALPLTADTNSSTLQGFDVPTMRGMTDRFLQFSMGTTLPEELQTQANSGGGALGFLTDPLEAPIQWDPNKGYDEITVFGGAFGVFQPVYNVRPLHLFQMFEEASTGFSGATGRQITLNSATALQGDTLTVMSELEAADERGVVSLFARGRRNGASLVLPYENGSYAHGNVSLSPSELRTEAAGGTTLMTLTAHLPDNVGASPQPLLDTAGASTGGPLGNPPLPRLGSGGGNPAPFNVTGVDVSAAAVVFVDGQPQTGASIGCSSSGGFCANGTISIDLAQTPDSGSHLLQVQNPEGLLSNELPICVGSDNACLDD